MSNRLPTFVRATVLALLLGLACAAFASAQELTVRDAVDSLAVKADADPRVARLCLRVLDQRPDSTIVSSAQADTSAAGACAGFNGVLVFVRQPGATYEELQALNDELLDRYPYLLVACSGRRQGPDVVPACHAQPPARRTSRAN